MILERMQDTATAAFGGSFIYCPLRVKEHVLCFSEVDSCLWVPEQQMVQLVVRDFLDFVGIRGYSTQDLVGNPSL